MAPADTRRELAERVRRALIERAQAAHEDAGIRGLCCEGAWEAVVSALRAHDLDDVLGAATAPRESEG
ncbi:MAG: acetyltransferase [Polyangiaceae bacterium]